MKRALRSLWRTLAEILRELADERAYERYLRVHGRAASAGEWRRFSEERLRMKYQRPRCC